MKNRSEIYAHSRTMQIIALKIREIQADARYLEACVQGEGYDQQTLGGGVVLRRTMEQAVYWSEELLKRMMDSEKATKAMDDLDVRPG